MLPFEIFDASSHEKVGDAAFLQDLMRFLKRCSLIKRKDDDIWTWFLGDICGEFFFRNVLRVRDMGYVECLFRPDIYKSEILPLSEGKRLLPAKFKPFSKKAMKEN